MSEISLDSKIRNESTIEDKSMININGDQITSSLVTSSSSNNKYTY